MDHSPCRQGALLSRVGCPPSPCVVRLAIAAKREEGDFGEFREGDTFELGEETWEVREIAHPRKVKVTLVRIK
ncbi:DUF6406 domain-containing protein [Actinopolymorpha pittospori]